MRGGDRFSGKLLNPEVKIQTEYMTATYEGAEINRIDFAAEVSDKGKLLLINGDVIQGILLLDEIRIEPDSFAQFTADKSKFSSIQFNAHKLLIKEYSSGTPPEQDSDGDGVHEFPEAKSYLEDITEFNTKMDDGASDSDKTNRGQLGLNSATISSGRRTEIATGIYHIQRQNPN